MVYIEIITYTYCIIFSIACYLLLKNLYTKKLAEIEQTHQNYILELENKFSQFRIKQDKSLITTRYEVSKENKLYLSQMNEDISAKIKELADIVKNRPII
tara:strand:+ start:117 stop:416 length:300 start_codon:yes stop_codon:yes gene_type:complete